MSTVPPIIQFQEFEKCYDGVRAIRPLSLSVEAGEAFALLGPNGSGKSTLIRALAGLHAPSGGRVLVEGFDISKQWERTSSAIAYLPQRVTMPGQLTAMEILLFFAELRQVGTSRVEEVLDFVALSGDADRKVREFSGGMLQRLGLAVVFLQDVPIYVLDEPTQNLDPIGVDRFRARIQQLKQRGSTVVFSSHIIQDAAQLADRVGILSEGRLVRVESASSFRNLLSQQTTVRVVLEEPSEEIVKAAVQAGAATSSVNGRHYAFTAPASVRLDVIRAIETAGGMIEEFHADPPEWDVLIRKGSDT